MIKYAIKIINIIVLTILASCLVEMKKPKKEEVKEKKIEVRRNNRINKKERPRQNKGEIPIAVLNIPKINISLNIYSFNSKLNNVDKGIEIMKGSTLPEEKGSSTVLVAHSGYKNKYFDNLDMLVIGDNASLTYQNNIYNYKVINKKKKLKREYLSIIKTNKNRLTLVTCDKEEPHKNLIVVLEEG